MNGISFVPTLSTTPPLRAAIPLAGGATVGYASDSIARPKSDEQIKAFLTSSVVPRTSPMLRHTMTVTEATQFSLSLNADPLKPFHDGSTRLSSTDKITVWFQKNATTKNEKAKKFDHWKDAKVVAIYRQTANRDKQSIPHSNHKDFGAWDGKPTHLKVHGLRLLAKRVPDNLKTNWKNAWGGIINPTASAGSITVWSGSVLGRNGIMWGSAYLARIIANQPTG